MRGNMVRSGRLLRHAAMAAAKDRTAPPMSGVAVEFRASVVASHIFPEGEPLPGLHLEMRAKGRRQDVYITTMVS